MLSDVMEDYLKVIYHLEQNREGRIKTSEIAEYLDVTSPTVTSMIDKLEERGLVDREKYKGVVLSEDGERVALEVVRHHRLLEAYLTERLDYDWSEVHEEADRLEHHISEKFEERVVEALGDPEVDPHGDPIPNAELDPPVEGAGDRLTEFDEGDRVIVDRISDQDPAVLQYLSDHSIDPGVELEIDEVAPFGMVTVQVADETVSLPERIAAHVEVDTLSATRPTN
ncbi:metal-dependent transcriptional regulator [Natranaeroarchaeum aerophilus]|uniref:Metal-dependent transcriptional regulator n=2 Tax=Natranaeroarchaeum aerophilus TaxID=2917711 RepID=A0AAE3K5B5_9EURY|nr:metal-dependent transcriptional regulator [Natranaeroarchaeum aerophilus]MCL9813836.1 metal-dependent transcriptional regulator [Natranaeroarchaeum aerophilus]